MRRAAGRPRLYGLDGYPRVSDPWGPYAVQAARDGAASRGAGLDVAPLMIPKELLHRLDALARRMGLPTAALGTLLLEAAVNEEERRFARERRVARELEAVLVRAILQGDDDPAAGPRGVRGRPGPPPPDGGRR